MGSVMDIGHQMGASQTCPNFGQHKFVPRVVTESMIGKQAGKLALKGMIQALPNTLSERDKIKLSSHRAEYREKSTAAMRPLLYGGQCKQNLTIAQHWATRHRPRSPVQTKMSMVRSKQCFVPGNGRRRQQGVMGIRIQSRQEPHKLSAQVGVVKAARKCLDGVDLASRKCLVLESLKEM